MKVKIHCFEGEWNDKYQDLSIRPLIHVLEQSYKATGVELSYTYKFCQTTTRLRQNLQLDGRSFAKQNYLHCLYFAFHGNGTGLFSTERDEQLTFQEIAQLIGTKASGSIIFFGSCSAGRTSREELKKLKAATDAKLVVGYGASVDWVASSAFEMLFFSELCRYKRHGDFRNKIEKIIAPGQELFSLLKVLMV